MSTTSPNMLLIIPEVGVTVGPDWANEVVSALGRIDAHDHTSGEGVQVPTAGIAINADLTFNSYGSTSIAFCGFTDQTSDPATLRSLYTKDGELYYQDSASNAVQLTNAGTVNVSAGELSYKLVTTYPYNILLTDTNKVLGITTTSARTVTLPSATNTFIVFLKDITGSAETNNITVNPSGSDTIDGATSFTIEGDWSAFGFISDGTSNWSII